MYHQPEIINSITYRQLIAMSRIWTDEQLDSTITISNGWEDECFAVELRIADSHHDSLDENHPFLHYNTSPPSPTG